MPCAWVKVTLPEIMFVSVCERGCRSSSPEPSTGPHGRMQEDGQVLQEKAGGRKIFFTFGSRANSSEKQGLTRVRLAGQRRRPDISAASPGVILRLGRYRRSARRFGIAALLISGYPETQRRVCSR